MYLCIMNSREKLLQYLRRKGESRIHKIAIDLKLSRQYIHKLMIELEESGIVNKIGLPPKVYYVINNNLPQEKNNPISYEDEKFLKDNFLCVDALGILLEGMEAFEYWCLKQNLPIEKTLEEYISTRKKYLKFYNSNYLIDGLEKIKGTKGISTIGVDQLYYLDFYAIERFGKTRMGALMHFAKQGQNKNLMKWIVDEIKQRILKYISDHHVDAVLFVPPTINRKLQIMDYLQNNLSIDLPLIKIEKIKTQIIIPQKALSKVFERVANARNTFIIPEQRRYNHILIIDDAIGSGATINEIAIKIREKKLSKKITGLAITGSYKGFEVISEL